MNTQPETIEDFYGVASPLKSLTGWCMKVHRNNATGLIERFDASKTGDNITSWCISVKRTKQGDIDEVLIEPRESDTIPPTLDQPEVKPQIQAIDEVVVDTEEVAAVVTEPEPSLISDKALVDNILRDRITEAITNKPSDTSDVSKHINQYLQEKIISAFKIETEALQITSESVDTIAKQQDEVKQAELNLTNTVLNLFTKL